jgi:hypothetical protein
MIRKTIKALTPPLLWKSARSLSQAVARKSRLRFEGTFDSWGDALNESDGYDLARLGARHIVIDRTPVLVNTKSRVLTVQHVPPSIYEASYPCWLFPPEFPDRMFPDHAVAASWTNPDRIEMKGRDVVFNGYLLKAGR